MIINKPIIPLSPIDNNYLFFKTFREFFSLRTAFLGYQNSWQVYCSKEIANVPLFKKYGYGYKSLSAPLF